MTVQAPHGEDRVVVTLELTERDLRDLALIKRSPERMNALAGKEQGVSREELVHAVLESGIKREKERAMSNGYEQLAASEEYKAEVAARRANIHKRRKPMSAKLD